MKTLLFILLTSIPSFINAQNLIKSKTTDNWYVGVNMGWSAKYNGNCVGYYHNEEPGTTRNLDDYNIMKNLNMNMGLRIGSHLTPTFGLGLDISGSFGNNSLALTLIGFSFNCIHLHAGLSACVTIQQISNLSSDFNSSKNGIQIFALQKKTTR